MMDLGLNFSDREKFEQTLTEDHQINVRIENMTLEHEFPRDISDTLLEGQVTISGVAELSSRELTVKLLDPQATLGFDSGDPSDGIMFADRMLRVRYEVYCRNLQRWVSVPVFTGPVTSLDRSGPVITLQASSKEFLANAIWSSFTIPIGRTKVEAMKEIMDRAGETKYSTIPTTSKLGAAKTLAHPQIFWQEAKELISSADQELYYNGLGILLTRSETKTTSYSFKDGNSGTILTEPQITYDPDTLRNTVKTEGPAPTTGKPPSFTAYAAPDHPLSAQSLGRNGKLRYIPEVFQSDSYKTVAECEKRAKSLLASGLLETIEVKFDSLVVPHLEANDLCQITTDKMALEFTMKEFTIPLTPNGVMTVGYTRKQSLTPELRLNLMRRIK